MMNYAVLALVVLIIVGLLTWKISERKHFPIRYWEHVNGYSEPELEPDEFWEKHRK